jgi:hypothetical protein
MLQLQKRSQNGEIQHRLYLIVFFAFSHFGPRRAVVGSAGPFKVFRAAAFLGGSAWLVVDVFEEDPDGSIKFSCPVSWLRDGSGETVSVNVDKRPATTALCDTLSLGEELPSPWTPPGTLKEP